MPCCNKKNLTNKTTFISFLSCIYKVQPYSFADIRHKIKYTKFVFFKIGSILLLMFETNHIC